MGDKDLCNRTYVKSPSGSKIAESLCELPVEASQDCVMNHFFLKRVDPVVSPPVLLEN